MKKDAQNFHEKREYIVFQLNNEFFCIPIQSLNQISRSLPTRFFPNIPSYIKGIIELDEKIIPIINLKKRLGLQDGNVVEDTFLLIYENEGHYLAFEVDAIFEILETRKAPKKDFSYVSKEIHLFSDGTFRFLRGDFGHTEQGKEELLILLNLRKIHDTIKRETLKNGN